MNEIIKSKWARAYCNENIVYLETVSGYRGGTHADPKGKQYILKKEEANSELLGSALLDVLNNSRWVLAAPRPGSIYPEGVEFDNELYSQENMSKHYTTWLKTLQDEYGYSSKKKLLKNMVNCHIFERDGIITIVPSHHSKLEEWQGFSLDHPDVVRIAENSKHTDLGDALCLALSRCTY